MSSVSGLALHVPGRRGFVKLKERYLRGRVSNYNQSEARKQCFLDSDWLKF